MKTLTKESIIEVLEKYGENKMFGKYVSYIDFDGIADELFALQQPESGKTAEEMVKENFQGLDELIKDKDILHFYKELIKTCLIEFASQPEPLAKQYDITVEDIHAAIKCYIKDKSQPERGEQPSDEKKEERCGTCGMLMDIKSEPEYICMNPDCENYCKTNK